MSSILTWLDWPRELWAKKDIHLHVIQARSKISGSLPFAGRGEACELIPNHPSLTLPIKGEGTRKVITRDVSGQHLHIL